MLLLAMRIQRNKYVLTEGSIHALIWALLLLLPYLVSTAANDYKIGPIPGLFFTISGFIHMGIFYSNAFFFYPRLRNRKYWWLYIPVAILLLFVSFQLKYYILAFWFPDVLKDMASYKFIFGPSVGIFFISIIYRRVADKIRLEKEQEKRRTEQLSTELKFLRSQISPHFLFNVLTNLVSLARKKSDRLESSLIMLSDLMRYMLYDTQGKKVSVSKEIAYLNSYIALQQLRFGNEVAVNTVIDTEEETESYTIEPMLLIPFVENAFKHGVNYLSDPQIDIHLLVKGGQLTFDVKNRFDEGNLTVHDENSGIGLSNVRTRLDMLYKGKYTLLIRKEKGVFHITLTLVLT
ncbi:histidine kinase [Chitinophaga filiformis]|uniref:sensor histidine kinase n=1 Tax=Chitinophaga filiformis TaxID=104663 RepID=UPI001F3BD091|nr:histidine kinase [Chitinophaga filiformis]MCF6405013.1 histidine kinase [Chitinophaga filiformis]